MIFQENSTFYDILDISPDASPQEVRDAFVRCKSTYQRDSLVLYSLIDSDERENLLKTIEEAYAVLSDSEKRREYDRYYGIISPTENPFPEYQNKYQAEPPKKNQNYPKPNHEKIDPTDDLVSIDRIPPMESLPDGDAILVPPTTDFTGNREPLVDNSFFEPTEMRPAEEPPSPRAYARIPKGALAAAAKVAREGELREKEVQKNKIPVLSASMAELEPLISVETEWSGPFLKKIRIAAEVSIEEMSDITKVTKTYMNAIEDEAFARLPAAVYVRGFLQQIAKVLKLPPEKVASAYLSRYNAKRNASK